MNLYIDTATSDRWVFPRKGVTQPDEGQPHMVRLAWLLEGLDGTTIREASHLIKMPQGEQIKGEAAHHTGIYDHALQERGMAMFNVLTEFAEALGDVQLDDINNGMGTGLVVAHSWAFHRQVLDRSFRYVGMPAREWPSAACVMIQGTNIVQIPKNQPGGGFRWPNFSECCERFLGAPLLPTSDPVADGIARVRAVRLFWSNIRRHHETTTGHPEAAGSAPRRYQDPSQ